MARRPSADAGSIDVQIIACRVSHAEAIRAIFNEVIANSTALYEYEPRSLETVHRWLEGRLTDGWPVIGAETASGELLGFASYGSFRMFPAYQYTAEHSVYVAAHARGKGIGRGLLDALVDRAIAGGLHVLVGGIDAENEASRGLHRTAGFTHSGTIRQAGWKFGRWLDLEFWQRILPGPAAS